MKYFSLVQVTVSCLVAAASSQFVDPQNAKILKEQRFDAGDGRFGSAFAQEDGTVFREETTADGERIGQYSYIDENGQTITVRYTAGKDGFRILEGDHIPTGANGQNSAPFVAEAAPAVAPVAPVAAPVQPVAPVVRPQLVRTPAPAPAAPQVDQAALIQQIISQLQPSISSAVESAISTRQASAARSSVSSGSSATSGFFGGENSVRIETPQFNIQY